MVKMKRRRTSLNNAQFPRGAEVTFRRALALWRTGTEKKQRDAIELFERVVEFKNPVHLQTYGSYLCWEPSAFRNFERGFQLLLVAAELGNTAAQYQVAAELAAGESAKRDLPAAARWYEKAAASGNIEAKYNLATMYLRGEGVRPDMELALRLLEEAAESGELLAMRALAEGYSLGANGIPKNPGRATHWTAKYTNAMKK